MHGPRWRNAMALKPSTSAAWYWRRNTWLSSACSSTKMPSATSKQHCAPSIAPEITGCGCYGGCSARLCRRSIHTIHGSWLLQGRTLCWQQELVLLPQRGNATRQGPHAFAACFLPHFQAVLKTLIGPHVKPAVQIANLGIPGTHERGVLLAFLNGFAPGLNDFGYGSPSY